MSLLLDVGSDNDKNLAIFHLDYTVDPGARKC